MILLPRWTPTMSLLRTSFSELLGILMIPMLALLLLRRYMAILQRVGLQRGQQYLPMFFTALSSEAEMATMHLCLLVLIISTRLLASTRLMDIRTASSKII